MSSFIKLFIGECPMLSNDFLEYLSTKHNNWKNWKNWNEPELLGWLMMYLSDIYSILPELHEKGEYHEFFIPNQPKVNNYTQFELSMYNILCELIRVENYTK